MTSPSQDPAICHFGHHFWYEIEIIVIDIAIDEECKCVFLVKWRTNPNKTMWVETEWKCWSCWNKFCGQNMFEISSGTPVIHDLYSSLILKYHQSELAKTSWLSKFYFDQFSLNRWKSCGEGGYNRLNQLMIAISCWFILFFLILLCFQARKNLNIKNLGG